jgi:hypothetical protein
MAGMDQLAKIIVNMTTSNDLESIVKKKIEELGEEFIREQAAGAFSGAKRISDAIETGGGSEITRLAERAIRYGIPDPITHARLLRKVQGAIDNKRRKGSGAWANTTWASSRDDWLDNKWRHDWRSQPRNVLGQWIPGRLNYINDQMKWRGSRIGRRTKRRRKLRRRARMMGRKAARNALRNKNDAD